MRGWWARSAAPAAARDGPTESAPDGEDGSVQWVLREGRRRSVPEVGHDAHLIEERRQRDGRLQLVKQLLRFGVVSRRRAEPTSDVLDHRAHHAVLVDVGREQSALVQRVDRPALDIEVAGLAHRTDQLAWLRVPNEFLFGPVRLP